MPQQFVDVVEVHVVVAHLVGLAGQFADVSVAVHLRAPFLVGASEVAQRVLRGVRVDGRHVGHHAAGIGVEVRASAVVPPQHVAHVGPSPSRQWRAPSDASVEPCLAVPQSVGSSGEAGAQRVDIGVGGVDAQSFVGRQPYGVLLREPQGAEGVGDELPVGCEQDISVAVVGPGECLERDAGRLVTASWLQSIVTVASHLFLGHVAHDGVECRRVTETFGVEAPDGTFLCVGGQGGDVRLPAAPRVVAEGVAPPPPFVACLAEGSGVERLESLPVADEESDVDAIVAVVGGEHGSVAGFEPHPGVRTIEGARVAVVPVDAHDFPVVGEVVHGSRCFMCLVVGPEEACCRQQGGQRRQVFAVHIVPFAYSTTLSSSCHLMMAEICGMRAMAIFFCPW